MQPGADEPDRTIAAINRATRNAMLFDMALGMVLGIVISTIFCSVRSCL